MRIFLMLLVLANFAFFAWQQWHANDEVRLPATRTDADLDEPLRLLDEEPATAAEPEQPAVPTTAELEAPEIETGTPADNPERQVATCATLGPFDERGAAEAALARLAELGHVPALREIGGQIRSGFWVYLPPFESRNAAKEVAGELQTRGVRDLFIVTASDQRNAISLGLFSTPERADQRAAEIGRLGYAPRVAERFRDATVYWLDFREQAGQPLEPEAVGVMGAGDTVPEKREIPCSEIAEPAGGA